MERLRRNLAKGTGGMKRVEENLSHAIQIVERELGAHINYEYPLTKFWNQYEECQWYRDEEKKQEARGRGTLR